MKSDAATTQRTTGKRDSASARFRAILNASPESTESDYKTYSAPPLLNAFHKILLDVSMYLAYGHLIYNYIDVSFPMRIQFSRFIVNPVGLILPAVFSWFTTYLTKLVIGKDNRGISSFWFSLINFFIVLFVNATVFFCVIFLNMSNPSMMPPMIVLLGPTLLYGGVFWNWGCVNFLLTPSENMRSGHRPVSKGVLIFAKTFCFIMSILSLLPVLWFGMDYLKSFVK
jgi:hypothetical protein